MYTGKENLTDYIQHYGTKRHSGRYPWGSGGNPYQRTRDFIGRVDTMQKKGMSKAEIMKELDIETPAAYNDLFRYANNNRRIANSVAAMRQYNKGKKIADIAKDMHVPDSTVRGWLDEDKQANLLKSKALADFLMKQADEKGMIDVGAGTQYTLAVSKDYIKYALENAKNSGYRVFETNLSDAVRVDHPTNIDKDETVTKTKLEEATVYAEQEGYGVFAGRHNQATGLGKTTTTVLGSPDKKWKDMFQEGEVQSIADHQIVTDGNGDDHVVKLQYPKSFSSKRLMVRYNDDPVQSGSEMDGVIELRRGVDDISLGEGVHYNQVRILVDGTHYLKGMAVYADDLPDGVDIRFNTNKNSDVPALGEGDKTVLKHIKTDDPNNPFGSAIKSQVYYNDKDGKPQLSCINIREEEGGWANWKKSLPAQFAAKQSESLINTQIKKRLNELRDEKEEIERCTNPTVKKELLMEFAAKCDTNAETLSVAALPGQKWHVMLPVPSLKDDEVYAPNYPNGTRLALVRYPHGGTFEIPVLTVNNNNKEGDTIISKDSIDGIGVNKKNADILSGADFDGDTVMAIPTDNGVTKIAHRDPLPALEGFDPKTAYPEIKDDHMTYMKKKNVKKEMGTISNLIMDMTILGAEDEDLAKAVKHSMVVIDAEKHKLNFKKSEVDNDIKYLKEKYQGHIGEDDRYHEGAGTLITRSKSPIVITKHRGSPSINPETGELMWKDTTETKLKRIVDKETGEISYEDTDELRTEKSIKMRETKDAMDLLSEYQTSKEKIYGNYANNLKAMANDSRKEYLSIKDNPASKTAKQIYSKEVEEIDSLIRVTESNKPAERLANRLATQEVKDYIDEYGEIDYDEKKKMLAMSLNKYREQVGAKRTPITLTDKQVEAIQSDAINVTTLRKLMNYCDSDVIKRTFTPKANQKMTPQLESLINGLNSRDYSIAEIARRTGLSVSTISDYLKGGK